MDSTKSVLLEDVKLIFRNFSGRADDYNTEGRRSFGIILNPEQARILTSAGFVVKELKSRDPQEDVVSFISVRIRFDKVAPKVRLITSTKQSPLVEETISLLDHADIKTVDTILTPYRWERNGKSGITAYVDSLYVTVKEDALSSKYSNIESTED